RHPERITTLAAVLLGQRRGDPALRAERPVELPVVAGPGVVRAFDHLGPQVLAEELTHFVAEGVALGAEAEVHQLRPAESGEAGPNSASARCSAPRRGSPRRSGQALARR